ERLRKFFERGHATVSARWVEEPSNGAAIEVDVIRAKAVVKALRTVGKKLKIKGDVDLATVARIPDVVRIASSEKEVEGKDILAIVDAAAKACVTMREREGKALVKDLEQRLSVLGEKAALIAKRAPDRLKAEVERLRANVQELAGKVSLDEGRLAQEIAHLAD